MPQAITLTPFDMDGIQTHPSNAAQAKAFTAPGSLSFPNAGNELQNGHAQPVMNGIQPTGIQTITGISVTPATPAATPAAQQGGSGLTPTLQ